MLLCWPASCKLRYELPMNEVVMDFFDKLKSVAVGFASLGLQPFSHFNAAPLCPFWTHDQCASERWCIGVIICTKTTCNIKGVLCVKKWKELISRQMFDVGDPGCSRCKKSFLETTVKALRKKTLSPSCYGVIVSRKKENSYRNKKTAKSAWSKWGNVEVPPIGFSFAVFATGIASQTIKQVLLNAHLDGEMKYEVLIFRIGF